VGISANLDQDIARREGCTNAQHENTAPRSEHRDSHTLDSPRGAQRRFRGAFLTPIKEPSAALDSRRYFDRSEVWEFSFAAAATEQAPYARGVLSALLRLASALFYPA
jgi:hypothetical protein